MIFHGNRLLADDSLASWNIIPYFFLKLEKMSQNVSSAAVVIGPLRVNIGNPLLFCVRLKIISGSNRTRFHQQQEDLLSKGWFLSCYLLSFLAWVSDIMSSLDWSGLCCQLRIPEGDLSIQCWYCQLSTVRSEGYSQYWKQGWEL